MSITRIPATITVTATGHKTEGKVVIVAVEELDRLEARCAAVTDALGVALGSLVEFQAQGCDTDRKLAEIAIAEVNKALGIGQNMTGSETDR